MEENLEPIKEVNNELSDNINRSNSEEVKIIKVEILKYQIDLELS